MTNYYIDLKNKIGVSFIHTLHVIFQFKICLNKLNTDDLLNVLVFGFKVAKTILPILGFDPNNIE